MPAVGLIMQDAVVSLEISNSNNPFTSITWGAPISLIGDLRNIRIRDSVQTVSVAGIGDIREYIRAKRGSTQITLEKFVRATSSSGGVIGENKIGFFARVSIKVLSSFTGTTTFSGVITEWEWGGGDEEQLERLTIDCDAEHVSSPL